MDLFTLSISVVLVAITLISQSGSIEIECAKRELPERNAGSMGDVTTYMLGNDELEMTLYISDAEMRMFLTEDSRVRLYQPTIKAKLHIEATGTWKVPISYAITSLFADSLSCNYTMHAYSSDEGHRNLQNFAVKVHLKEDESCFYPYDDIIEEEIQSCLQKYIKHADYRLLVNPYVIE